MPSSTRTGAAYAQVPTRTLTAFAKDPTLRDAGGPITTDIVVPAERFGPGPSGHRIAVVDFDATVGRRYRPLVIANALDPFAKRARESLDADPQFHQQHVYATAMATLTLFEAALGRHLRWGFLSGGHQLKLAPHAFAEPNAYYSRGNEAIYFGYFYAKEKPIFTCLSRDVVVHETTHACLDGLRSMLVRPSSPDQAAFHEGFADLIAILSLFRSPELIAYLLGPTSRGHPDLIESRRLTRDALSGSVLFSLAEQMGEALSGVRGQALRNSLKLNERPARDFKGEEFRESHARGEILVAALLRAFLDIWDARLAALGRDVRRRVLINRALAAEEGCRVAGQLMRIAIRAIDYMPPVDIRFEDYLSALLTADSELHADDHKFDYRARLREAFAHFDISPASSAPEGLWERPRFEFDYTGTHFTALQHDPDAVYRFIWQNWKALQLNDNAFTRLISVRPCMRTGSDGFFLRETVAEYVQTLEVFPSELAALGIRTPGPLPRNEKLRLYGSGVLIFDEFGRVKYQVGHGIRNRRRKNLQTDRLRYLFENGQLPEPRSRPTRFAELHRAREHTGETLYRERW